MPRAIGRAISCVGTVALTISVGGCAPDRPMVLRAATCNEASFAAFALPRGFASPAGKGYIFKCDLYEAERLSSALPIEVYADQRRAEVLGWLYLGACGFPEGLVRVGEKAPEGCPSTATYGLAPPP